MASFKDKKGQEWLVELDAPTIERIRDEHGIDLVKFEKTEGEIGSSDPLRIVRRDPMTLVAVIHALCSDQISERNLTPAAFAKLLPVPPDPMLDALKEAVISFFPSGLASHVREVLLKFDQMAEKTDQLALAKMEQIISDPAVMQKLSQKADRVIKREIEKIGMETSVGT